MNFSEDTDLTPDQIKLLKNGDRMAWEKIILQFSDPLLRLIYHLCERNDLAEDVRQETFIAAMAGIHQYKGEAPLFAWLCGIARRKTMDALRKTARLNKKEKDLDEENDFSLQWLPALDGELWPSALAEKKETKVALIQALFSLPESYRDILVRRYLLGEDITTLADRLNCSYKSAESQLTRARRKLKQYLEEVNHD